MKPVVFHLVAFFCVAELVATAAPPSPVQTLEFRTSGELAVYVRHVREILDADVQPNQDALRAIQKRLTAARRLCRDDPRLEYACGLVLLKHWQHQEAAEHFEKAVQTGRFVYLPAREAHLRTRLLLKDENEVLSALAELARAVQNPNTHWRNQNERSEAANLIGRVMEYLSLPEVTFIDSAAVARHEKLIENRLDAATEKSYRDGRRFTAQKHQDLLGKIEQTRAPAEARHQQDADEKLAEIEQREQTLERQGEDLQLNREEWQAWLDKRLDEADKQLKLLQQDYRVLDTAARSVSARIAEIQVEITRLQVRLNFEKRRHRRQSPLSVALLQRQQELLKYQGQFNLLKQQALGVVSRAGTVLDRRNAAVRRFQQATGDLAQREESLETWLKALQQSALKVSEQAAAQPMGIRLLSKRLSLPSTYFAFDFEAEKQRILDSYSVPDSNP